MAQLKIALLGSFQAWYGGQPLTGFRYDKVRALLAFLAVERQRAHRRDELLGMFWPESAEEDARTSLRQALAHLRAAVGDNQSSQPCLIVSRESVQWNAEADAAVDVLAFEDSLQFARQHIHRSPRTCRFCERQLAQAVQQYQGDFLAHFFLPGSAPFEDWVVLKREGLRRQALEALDQLAMVYERRGDYRQAEETLRRLTAIEPWQEEAHCRLMCLLVLNDQRGAALAQYEVCRKTLQEALDVPPQPETIALFETIRDSKQDGGPLPGFLYLAGGRKHNLLPPLTPFIGREKELADIQALLDKPDCRLITILGPGGVGKTRLALQVGYDQVESFTDGVFFVPLASLKRADMLPAAVAEALQISLSGETDPLQQLLEGFAGKEMLLILDNLEHLPEARVLIREILSRAPGMVIAATSRDRLRISAEWTYPLLGLPVQQQAGQPRDGEGRASDLFIQTALRHQPGITFDAAQRAAIEQICLLLEGIPLAIELAAGWTSMLTTTEIVQEIQANLDFLSVADQDTPARHASMRAVFDHSWSLLEQEEQSVFRKLAIFSGGFIREPAERVAGAALPQLRSLLDKSLMKRSPFGRYELHELARQYAYQRLVEAGEVDTTRDTALAYFVDLAESAAPHLEGEQGPNWMQRLEEEMGNLREALDWSLQSGQIQAGMRLAWALFRFWYWHNQHIREARRLQEQLLAAANGVDIPVELVGNVLYETGVMASMQRDIPAAETYFQRSLAIREASGDKHGQAAVLNSLGTTAFEQEDYARALTLFEASLVIRRELGQKPSVQLSNLGVVAQIQGDYAKAQEYFEESLQIDREAHNQGGIAIGLGSLARVLLSLGDRPGAFAYFQESLQLRRELGDQEGIAYAIEGLATFYAGSEGEEISETDARQAVMLFSAASCLRQAIGVPLSQDEIVENQPFLDRAQAVLGDQAFQDALKEGSQTAIEDMIQAALDQTCT